MLVFDAEPLLAFFTGEAEAPAVRRLLDRVHQGKEEGGVCTVNLAEAFYFLHRRSEQDAESAVTALGEWGLVFHPADAVWKEAAKLKADHAIPLGDAYAAATALSLKAELVCGADSPFDKIAGVRLRRI